jgi:uncharacterized membrane protein (UPF0127 family)
MTVLAAGCSTAPGPASQPEGTAPSAGPVVTVGDADPITVEVADDAQERRRGLMGRPDVPVGTGMLFLYETPVLGAFWMGNVEVPLSIAWVSDGVVVGVAEMQPCPAADATCPRYAPDVPYDTAVETTGGTFTDAGVSIGDKVTIEDQ